jgi:ketosteroid isomerase-like protein
MSQENVEIAQAAFDAWNRGDMAALRELYDPDAIMRLDMNWVEPGPFVGRDTIMRQFEYLRDTWDADALEPSEFIDAADRVVVRYVWRVTGRVAGPVDSPELNQPITLVYTMRKGRIFLAEFFRDHAEALEVAGLRE